ncbi:hypothetical protein ABK040_004072 [Willaertia magna]
MAELQVLDKEKKKYLYFYLSKEIQFEISSYLTFKELIHNFSLINKNCLKIVKTETLLWKNLLINDWKIINNNEKQLQPTMLITPVSVNQNDNVNEKEDTELINVDDNLTIEEQMQHHKIDIYELISNEEEIELIRDYNNIGDNNNKYFERYKQRYFKYKQWRDSIAFMNSTDKEFFYRDNLIIKNNNLQNIYNQQNKLIYFTKIIYNSIISWVTFPLIAFRLLNYLFFSTTTIPVYGLQNEVDYVKSKALKIAGSLLSILCFLPILISSHFTISLQENELNYLNKILFFNSLKGILCFTFILSNIYNEMNMNMEQLNNFKRFFFSVIVVISGVCVIVLMRHVDDLILLCFVVFILSLLLGLASSIRFMIFNEKKVNLLNVTNTTTTLAPTIATTTATTQLDNEEESGTLFINSPFITTIIGTYICCIVLVIAGFKIIFVVGALAIYMLFIVIISYIPLIVCVVTVPLISIILIVLMIVYGSGSSNANNKRINSENSFITLRTFIVIIVALLCYVGYQYARNGIKKKDKELLRSGKERKNIGAITLFMILMGSICGVVYRTYVITMDEKRRWPLSNYG